MSSFSRVPLTVVENPAALAGIVYGLPMNGVHRLVEGIRRHGRSARPTSFVDGNLQSHRYLLFSSMEHPGPFKADLDAFEIASALTEYRASGLGRVSLPATSV